MFLSVCVMICFVVQGYAASPHKDGPDSGDSIERFLLSDEYDDVRSSVGQRLVAQESFVMDQCECLMQPTPIACVDRFETQSCIGERLGVYLHVHQSERDAYEGCLKDVQACQDALCAQKRELDIARVGLCCVPHFADVATILCPFYKLKEARVLAVQEECRTLEARVCVSEQSLLLVQEVKNAMLLRLCSDLLKDDWDFAPNQSVVLAVKCLKRFFNGRNYKEEKVKPLGQTEKVFGVFLQGFFGVMEPRYRASVFTLIFKVLAQKPEAYALSLLRNADTVTVLSLLSVAAVVQKECACLHEVNTTLATACRGLESSCLIVVPESLEAQSSKYLQAFEWGVQFARALEWTLKQAHVPLCAWWFCGYYPWLPPDLVRCGVFDQRVLTCHQTVD